MFACFFLQGLPIELGVGGLQGGDLLALKIDFDLCFVHRFATPRLGRWFWIHFHFCVEASTSDAYVRMLREAISAGRKDFYVETTPTSTTADESFITLSKDQAGQGVTKDQAGQRGI